MMSLSCKRDSCLSQLNTFAHLFRGSSFEQPKAPLSYKIMEPSKVKTITRIMTTPEDPFEQEIIEQDLHFFYGMAHNAMPKPTHTFIMEGRPLFAQVDMKNGLSYLGIIADVGEISWMKKSGSSVSEFNPTMYTKAELEKIIQNKEIFHVADLDRHYYKIMLYPYHEDGKIRMDDFLDIGLRKGLDLDTKKPIELDGRATFRGSFKVLENNPKDKDGKPMFFIPPPALYPPHLCKVFKALENFYNIARQGNSLGEPIYSTFTGGRSGTQSVTIPKKGPLQTSDAWPQTTIINPNLNRVKKLSPSRTAPVLVGNKLSR